MNTTSLYAAASLLAATLAQADTTRVNGHDVWYEVHGDLTRDRTPILMLHGGMMTVASSFGDMIPELAERHPVIGVEQQGHGHTPLNDAPITMETMRVDTLGVLDALSVETVHVVGFSIGGMLGLELAVNAPDRVASLTAISASASPDGFLPDIIRMQKEPGYQPPPEVAALLPSEEEFARMAADIAALNPGGADTAPVTMQKLNDFITSDWGRPDARIAAIAAPALIVNGDNDFIRPAHALHLARTIPDARLAILPDTTHMSILDQPELFPMIRRFIRTAEAGMGR